MKKTLTILATAVIAFLLLAKPVLAAVRCETQYGGGEVCVRTGELQIDKEVWDPEDEKWLDNLGLGDYKFAPGESIKFKLKIKNVGDKTFSEVDVRDYLPDLVEHVSGDLEFEIKDLSPDETETRELEVKVVSADRFPNDKSIICEVNTAETWADDKKDKDTAQVCFEKKVLGVSELPPTGPENWLIIIPFSLLAGLVGFYLKKFSN